MLRRQLLKTVLDAFEHHSFLSIVSLWIVMHKGGSLCYPSLNQSSRRWKEASLRLALNFSPIRFDDAEITVGCLPYGQYGEQVLQKLRNEHSRTHVFRREGADSILAVPVASDGSLVGEPKAVRPPIVGGRSHRDAI